MDCYDQRDIIIDDSRDELVEDVGEEFVQEEIVECSDASTMTMFGELDSVGENSNASSTFSSADGKISRRKRMMNEMNIVVTDNVRKLYRIKNCDTLDYETALRRMFVQGGCTSFDLDDTERVGLIKLVKSTAKCRKATAASQDLLQSVPTETSTASIGSSKSYNSLIDVPEEFLNRSWLEPLEVTDRFWQAYVGELEEQQQRQQRQQRQQEIMQEMRDTDVGDIDRKVSRLDAAKWLTRYTREHKLRGSDTDQWEFKLNDELRFVLSMDTPVMRLCDIIACKKLDANKRKQSSTRQIAVAKAVTDEFADFARIDRGTAKLRGEVMKIIHAYISENGLKRVDETTGTLAIYIDEKLRKIFGIQDSSVQSIPFNSLLKYITRQFVPVAVDETKVKLTKRKITPSVIERKDDGQIDRLFDVMFDSDATVIVTDSLADLLEWERGTITKRSALSKSVSKFLRERSVPVDAATGKFDLKCKLIIDDRMRRSTMLLGFEISVGDLINWILGHQMKVSVEKMLHSIRDNCLPSEKLVNLLNLSRDTIYEGSEIVQILIEKLVKQDSVSSDGKIITVDQDLRKIMDLSDDVITLQYPDLLLWVKSQCVKIPKLSTVNSTRKRGSRRIAEKSIGDITKAIETVRV